MKKISSHKIVFLKYWGAKIDILEKKKLHKQQLLEKVDKSHFFFRIDAVYAEFLYLLCRRLKQRKQNCYKLRAGFYCSIGNLR